MKVGHLFENKKKYEINKEYPSNDRPYLTINTELSQSKF